MKTTNKLDGTCNRQQYVFWSFSRLFSLSRWIY